MILISTGIRVNAGARATVFAVHTSIGGYIYCLLLRSKAEYGAPGKNISFLLTPPLSLSLSATLFKRKFHLFAFSRKIDDRCMKIRKDSFDETSNVDEGGRWVAVKRKSKIKNEREKAFFLQSSLKYFVLRA